MERDLYKSFTHSINVKFREIFYKIHHQQYLTPTKLSKLFPNCDITCWCCHQVEADFVHFWRLYAPILVFWKAINITFNQRTNVSLNFMLLVFLLNDINTENKNDHILISSLLVTARLLSATNWQARPYQHKRTKGVILTPGRPQHEYELSM